MGILKPVDIVKLNLDNTNSPFGRKSNSMWAGSTLSHARDRQRAKQSGGKESGEEELDFTLAATRRMLLLQLEPAHRLEISIFFCHLSCIKLFWYLNLSFSLLNLLTY